MASSSVGSLLLVLVFAIIITEYAEAQFLRRIMGEEGFCEQKFDKCMHERTRMTKKGCEKRMATKYGCYFHNGVHHPRTSPDKHKEPTKPPHPPNNDSHHPHPEKHKEHPKSQQHPNNDSHHPHPEKHKEHPKSPQHPHNDSHHPHSENHTEHPKSQHH